MKSPHQIAEAIETTQDELESLEAAVRVAAENKAQAEYEFKVAFAKERAKARLEAGQRGEKLTTDAVEDAATIATADLRHAHLLTAELLTAVRESLRSTQSRLDGYRTMSASVRAAGG